jgi:hypothetical protein
MADSPTYVFDDNGKVYAYVDDKLVAMASSQDLDGLEQKMAAPPMPTPGAPPMTPPDGAPAPPGPPPMDDMGDAQPEESKGIHVVFEGELKPQGEGAEDTPPPPPEEGAAPDPLQGASPDSIPGDNLPPRATHIITPNGLKGQILGKVKGLWSDEVTIRLENGRIAKFQVTADSDIEYVFDEKVAASKYAELQRGLDADVDPTKSGLKRRIAELKTIKDEAKGAFRVGNYVDETTLHNIIVEADIQMTEVVDALEHMEQAEPYAPPETQVFEQESLGGNDSTWLDNTLNEMIQEAEATDFEQELEEMPPVLVAEQETPALQDVDGMQQYALSYVQSKTAGLEATAVSDFTTAFLTRVEACRVLELEARLDQPSVSKEASSEDHDGPAEGLFW